MTIADDLRHYREENEARERCFVYTVGDRGFFAEVTTVARAMIYAWTQGMQLVLDSSEFSYRYRVGWADYYRPFCKEVTEISGESIREWIRFTRRGDRRPFEKLRGFEPEKLEIGATRIEEMQQMLRHCMLLICQLGEGAREQVDALRRPLDLPSRYMAVHVRRGDKVGDEDIFYPVEMYLDRLELGGDEVVFVMSDDYRAVAEVREAMVARGLKGRVATLCRSEHTGFDIWKLRAGGAFAGSDRDLDDRQAYRRYVFEESNRLLAETAIAAGADRFVSTWGSNVGRTVWYLSDSPDSCQLIHRPARAPASTRLS
jgi:hypothetical protein